MLARRLVLAAPALLVAGPGFAHSYRVGDLMIGHAWCLPGTTESRAMMPLAVTGAVAETLLGASTPAAARVVMMPRAGQSAETWEIAPRRPVAMRPDGPHLALTGLVRPLASRDRVPLTLRFRNAGEKVVELWVESRPYGG